MQTGLHPLFLSTQGCWCTLAHLPKSVKHQCISILIGRNVLTPISGAPASCTIPATQPELQLAEGCSQLTQGLQGSASMLKPLHVLIGGWSNIPVIKDFEYHPVHEYISLLISSALEVRKDD